MYAVWPSDVDPNLAGQPATIIRTVGGGPPPRVTYHGVLPPLLTGAPEPPPPHTISDDQNRIEWVDEQHDDDAALPALPASTSAASRRMLEAVNRAQLGLAPRDEATERLMLTLPADEDEDEGEDERHREQQLAAYRASATRTTTTAMTTTATTTSSSDGSSSGAVVSLACDTVCHVTSPSSSYSDMPIKLDGSRFGSHMNNLRIQPCLTGLSKAFLTFDKQGALLLIARKLQEGRDSRGFTRMLLWMPSAAEGSLDSFLALDYTVDVPATTRPEGRLDLGRVLPEVVPRFKIMAFKMAEGQRPVRVLRPSDIVMSACLTRALPC